MTNPGAIVMVVLACACGPAMTDDADDDTGSGGGSGSDDVGGGGGSNTDGCTKIDLLFVIDDSGSMMEEQANLAANFPKMVSVLDQSGLDYRLAVTTTSVDYSFVLTLPNGTFPVAETGLNTGTMLKTPAMTNRWIDKAEPNVSATFATLASVGTMGSGTEMPLAAIRAAFERRMMDNTNTGFRRPDALLGIVILTDENDCSYEGQVTFPDSNLAMCESMMEPPASYKQFLDTYTGNATRWAAVMIAGPGPGACSSTFGMAEEATRLIEFKNQVGTNAIMSSICDGDLSNSLMDAMMLFESACGGIIL
jgi:hypothetical protein